MGKMNSDKYYRCATEVLDLIIKCVSKRKLRVDTIIWDSNNCTPRQQGKATIFQLMYYQLFKNTLKERWEGITDWRLFPDTQGSINWGTIEKILNNVLSPGIHHVEEINSKEKPLSQIPDIFAGLASFSRCEYEEYAEKYRAMHGTLDRWIFLM